MTTATNNTLATATAYRAFGIFADYDGQCHDSQHVVLVATKELARQVCEKANESGECCAVVCDGYEHAKRWRYQATLTEHPNRVMTEADDAYEALLGEDW